MSVTRNKLFQNISDDATFKYFISFSFLSPMVKLFRIATHFVFGVNFLSFGHIATLLMLVLLHDIETLLCTQLRSWNFV